MAQMWPPKKNTAFDLYFPIRDADGDPVSGAAGLDSERSIDGGAFSDCTNEATEIGTTGIYKLALTAGEMNGDVIIVQTKTTTTGAKTAVNVIYTTRSLWDDVFDANNRVKADVERWLAGTPNGLSSGRVDAAVGAMGAGVVTAAAIAADTIQAAKIQDGALTAAKFAAGALDSVWSTATRTLTGFSTGLAVAVWDVLESAVAVAGSMGLKVKTNLDVKVSTRVTGGAGALQRTIGVTVGGNPLEGASVWVATDAGGTNVVAGPLTTNSQGVVTVLLDAGTFYVWVQKDGYQAIVGQQVTVS
jgi:hypothetical protein